MDAPKCRICGKVEWNHSCSGAASLSNLPAEAARKKKSKLKLKPDNSNLAEVIDQGIHERLVILEALVAELIEARKKRSVYMKNYMRDRRKEGK